jgi:hypothetical protein
MEKAAEIVALRALGLSLVQVTRVLKGDPQFLLPALATHQEVLEGRMRRLADTVEGFAVSGPIWPRARPQKSAN